MRTVTALALGAALLAAGPAAHAAPAEPRIALDRETVDPGDRVTVELTGWPAGNVLVELCGNGARRGTVDCAVGASAGTFVRAGTAAKVVLTAAKPPVGCPCVIAVRPVTGGEPRTAPIAVTGVPTLPATEAPATGSAPTRRLTATKVEVTGGGVGPGWLAGSADRTLRVTLRNNGTAALTDPALTLTAGRGEQPARVIDAPPLGTLAPGAERTYAVPVTLDAPAFGRYTIRGEIAGLDEPIAFTAEAASYPWGLPILGALLVPVPLITARRRAARSAAAGGSPRPSATGRPARTPNRTVAANIAWWTRARGLTPERVAEALTARTGRPRTPADLPPRAAECPFDPDTLDAVSRILDVPVAALLLPAPGGDEVSGRGAESSGERVLP
ncbi:hypothetical protein [Actinomadura sp. WMMB 499]|uniref:hypothetical protein n=1 Tax=Actinomadura sp. WMMB 499 TaxID=1219491 RepID=UPI001246B686|nr:hypothetical protein [Actinomadura sp. WMMB 499]QFG22381.1 hypothetical protein F7P10_15860 [Actinomadura sp. WMMB 499]